MSAEVGRQADDFVAIAQRLKRQGHHPDAMIVQMGNNGPLYSDEMEELRKATSEVGQLFLIDDHAPVSWVGESNHALAEAARDWPHTTLIDWAPVAAAHENLLWDDIHLTPAGAGVYARLVSRRSTKSCFPPQAGEGSGEAARAQRKQARRTDPTRRGSETWQAGGLGWPQWEPKCWVQAWAPEWPSSLPTTTPSRSGCTGRGCFRDARWSGSRRGRSNGRCRGRGRPSEVLPRPPAPRWDVANPLHPVGELAAAGVVAEACQRRIPPSCREAERSRSAAWPAARAHPKTPASTRRRSARGALPAPPVAPSRTGLTRADLGRSIRSRRVSVALATGKARSHDGEECHADSVPRAT